MLNPCPKLPVAAFIHFKLGIGCPSNSLPNFLKEFKSSLMHPLLYKQEYNIGAACPLLKINSSFPKLKASLTSYLISLKNKTLIISAQLKQEVACPLLASVVISN